MRLIPDLLAKRAELSPARIGLQPYGGGGVTYAELDRRAGRAAGLLAELGVQPGDRVGVLCRNRVEFFELMFACARMGAVLAPLNWRSPAEELEPLMRMADVRILFHGREDAAAAAELCAAMDAGRIDLEADYAHRREAAEAVPARQWPDDQPWYLLFTSGTTGRPKAVVNTYGMALANAINIWTATDLTAPDRTLSFLPLFHAGGLGLHVLPALFAGAHVTVLPSFDADAVTDLIARRQVDLFFGVPVVYQQLWEHPRLPSLDLSSVRHWGCGGAALPDIVVRRYADRGALICAGMGMTETGPTAFLMDPGAVRDKVGSVGKPQILCEARLMVGEREAGAGETGEVQFRGAAVTPGYWRDEAATAAAFTADGWLCSGDLGRKDADGYYYVVGRSKEMFISGGENVYPVEVENVLLAHPGVAEAAVAGVADARWGEVGRAYLVARGGAALDADDLTAWCRARLAAYKAPKTYVFADALPRNALGKVLKHRLHELDRA